MKYGLAIFFFAFFDCFNHYMLEIIKMWIIIII